MVASPHSGRFLPKELLNNTRLSEFELRISEDFHVDELAASAANLGLDYIKGEISRIYVDLNRNGEIFDHLLIDGAKQRFDCTYTRVGIGVIPRIIAKNTKIYNEKIAIESATKRIEEIHIPYHNMITNCLEELNKKFSRALLLDMHSMPAKSLGFLQADIILGNRFGKSTDAKTIEMAKEFFVNSGLKVRLNTPFAGGFTTAFHANKDKNIFAMQIEINRNLYFDEQTQQKTSNFLQTQALIKSFFQNMIENF